MHEIFPLCNVKDGELDGPWGEIGQPRAGELVVRASQGLPCIAGTLPGYNLEGTIDTRIVNHG
ncbi:MAG TPA: hypothetical protein VHU84_05580, partial [Lacipirellulaceae bacterium]|nr:hypothetical protein [Lacipirellulaceae bacterium]